MFNTVINNNGDKAETLVDEMREAIIALQDACEKIGQCTTNGRNYQTVENGKQLLEQDLKTKSDMINTLCDMESKITDACLRVLDQ